MAEAGTQPTIEVLWPRPQVAQVVLGGEHDVASAEGVGDTFEAALSASKHLIVDLRETLFIDSSVIRALVMARREADVTEKRFTLLLGTASIVENALDLAGVLPELDRVHTLEEALTRPIRTDDSP